MVKRIFILLLCAILCAGGFAPAADESEPLDDSRREAIDTLIESLTILRSDSDTLRTVLAWFAAEMKRVEEEIAKAEAEIEALKKKLEEAENSRIALEKRVKTLRAGRELLSIGVEPGGDAGKTETAALDVPNRETPPDSGVIDPAPPPASAEDLFTQKVLPIFTENCLGCHANGDPGGGLNLTSRGTTLLGGASGPAIVPGKPEESLLYKMVAHEEAPFMPLGADKLNGEALAAIAAWIGAEQ